MCTTAHILGACQIALKQQRFTYRNDTVLSVLVSPLVKFLSSYVPSPNSSSGISFVEEGQKPKNVRKPKVGLLHAAAPKLKILYDFQDSPTVPSFLTVTTLRPDIVLYSSWARGYAAESLLSCLRCLRFPSKLCRSTIKNLSTTCLKCSFDIWIAIN